jgi:hypothetical protein
MVRHTFPSELDIRDPGFRDRYFLWAGQAQREIAELVAVTRYTIEASQALLEQADRMLAWNGTGRSKAPSGSVGEGLS